MLKAYRLEPDSSLVVLTSYLISKAPLITAAIMPFYQMTVADWERLHATNSGSRSQRNHNNRNRNCNRNRSTTTFRPSPIIDTSFPTGADLQSWVLTFLAHPVSFVLPTTDAELTTCRTTLVSLHQSTERALEICIRANDHTLTKLYRLKRGELQNLVLALDRGLSEELAAELEAVAECFRTTLGGDEELVGDMERMYVDVQSRLQ